MCPMYIKLIWSWHLFSANTVKLKKKIIPTFWTIDAKNDNLFLTCLSAVNFETRTLVKTFHLLRLSSTNLHIILTKIPPASHASTYFFKVQFRFNCRQMKSLMGTWLIILLLCPQFAAWVDAVVFVFSLEDEISFQTVYNYFLRLSSYRNTAEVPMVLVGTQGACLP